MGIRTRSWVFAIVVLFSINCSGLAALAADEDLPEEQLFRMNLEDILDLPVEVASKGIRQRQRQAAGSITILDAAYIERSGARDLLELLELVPGFQSHTEVVGGSLISFRGLQNSGRVLLRIDGQEMNELLYNTLLLGNHYPTAIIERIEIIRGPGSVLYGESAEYAVIEVVTKIPKHSGEGAATLIGGVTEESISRAGGTVWQTYGKNEEYITASFSSAEAVRGSGRYEDFYGNSFRIKGDQDRFMRFLNVGGKYHDFSFRYIRDRYHVNERDQYFIASPYAVSEEFNQDRLELKYSPKLTDDLSVTIQGNYYYDKTWKSNDESTVALELSDPDSFTGVFLNQHLRRIRGTTEVVYEPVDGVTILAGVSAWEDSGGGFEITGERAPDYDAKTKAFYGQALFDTSLLAINAGTRYEDNSNYGSAWVSRLALTKAESDWHAKVQAAEAFRAPGFQNTIGEFDPNNSDYVIEPEETLVLEAEVGRALAKSVYLTANVFDIQTEDTISYFYDEIHGDSYGNLGDVGSRGFEAILRYVFDRGEMALSYAYHRADNENYSYGIYGADGTVLEDKEFIGVAPHVAQLSLSIDLTERATLFSAFQYIGSKWQNVAVTEDDIPYAAKLPEEFLWRAALTFREVGYENLMVQVGVNNILDETIQLAYPSADYHPAMRGLGREFYVNARLDW